MRAAARLGLLLLGLAAAVALAATGADACAWWSNSTKAQPVPPGAVVINDPSSGGKGSLYACNCHGSEGGSGAGGLYNNSHVGWACVYTYNPFGGYSGPRGAYCGPGDYSVMVQKFKLSGDPKFVNSTADNAVPRGAIAYPLGSPMNATVGNGVCKAVARSATGDDTPVTGSLNWDPNGSRSCEFSVMYSNFGLISGRRGPGDYEVLVGTDCLLPPGFK